MEHSANGLDMAELAAKFINTTAKNIFLTGKAGTGKTTFLQNLKNLTHKKFLVTAPTGIAALNAGGVTIHSQFLLPLGAYIPEGTVTVTSGNYFDASHLVRRNPLNADRRKILREIDLLIIDEVSMLRADVLDAIDLRLRTTRKVNKPFGGLQLLLIGDMFQLPPVVRDEEMAVMKNYYPSLFFFESIALKKSQFAYIEFDKIYRQSDTTFIEVLNRLRTNSITPADIDLLNARYVEEKDLPDHTITLTTHNRQADDINKRELNLLPGEETVYDAQVDGTFPESMYPLDPQLVLKENARVMFVKNDPEGRFYNGKIATVTSLGNGVVTVRLSGGDREIEIEPMQWKNTKYTLDDSNSDLKEEVIGTFTQFPFKYAWAVTIHKSQGLTFSRAVMNIGNAFAPGQVYVALSRLTSLEGLYLRTKLNPDVILGDSRIQEFSRTKDRQPPPAELLREGQAAFVDELLNMTFDFHPILNQIDYANRKKSEKLKFPEESMGSDLVNLKTHIYDEVKNTLKFRRQLSGLLRSGDQDQVIKRARDGSKYYSAYLQGVQEMFLKHHQKVELMPRTKAYKSLLDEIDQVIMKKMQEVERVSEIVESIFKNQPPPDFSTMDENRLVKRTETVNAIRAQLKSLPIWSETPTKTKTAKTTRSKKGKPQKGATYTETFNLIKEGLSIRQIAVKRSLSESTIEGHVAKCIADGRLSVQDFMDTDKVEIIAEKFMEMEKPGLSEIYSAFKGEYSYQQLRMVQGHLQRLETAENPKVAE